MIEGRDISVSSVSFAKDLFKRFESFGSPVITVLLVHKNCIVICDHIWMVLNTVNFLTFLSAVYENGEILTLFYLYKSLKFLVLRMRILIQETVSTSVYSVWRLVADKNQ